MSEKKEKKARPSMAKAVREKCKECMANYIDGRYNCEIPTCPLYHWMPYKRLRRDKNNGSKNREN